MAFQTLKSIPSQPPLPPLCPSPIMRSSFLPTFALALPLSTPSPSPKPLPTRSPTLSISPPISRRTLLTTLLSLPFLPSPSFAYSSPYKPTQTSESPLPSRRYDSASTIPIITPSGLQYFDLLQGDGKEAKVGNTALVYYTSRLGGLNGIKIQSTYDDYTSPPCVVKIGDNDVVPGVSEALTGMKVGGKRRAVLPPKIGYRTPDMVPRVTGFFARRRLLSVLETSRDATIVFDLELVRVK